ncbi:kirola-like [Salvia miltiorrhiza]|uniref:kirola-like n=1 Tax=Salvia miltiorrhiza TaxID=226208 RepID=UPI0025AD5980|nr:kirola-like [Salvia miltiorrhiza]
MGLHGKLIAAIEFKAGGDVFHQLWRHNPHQLPSVAPHKIHSCDLHGGQFGHVDSILFWRYTHDGKRMTVKEVIQAIDEEKRLVQSKVVEGDIMQLYKDFFLTCHVETKGAVDLVTWTLEYEKVKEDVEHPISLLSFFIDLTKDIETHHLAKH